MRRFAVPPIKNVEGKPQLKTSGASIPDTPRSFPTHPPVIPDTPPGHSRQPPCHSRQPSPVIPDVFNRESSSRGLVAKVPSEGQVHPLYSGRKIPRLREAFPTAPLVIPDVLNRESSNRVLVAKVPSEGQVHPLYSRPGRDARLGNGP